MSLWEYNVICTRPRYTFNRSHFKCFTICRSLSEFRINIVKIKWKTCVCEFTFICIQSVWRCAYVHCYRIRNTITHTFIFVLSFVNAMSFIYIPINSSNLSLHIHILKWHDVVTTLRVLYTYSTLYSTYTYVSYHIFFFIIIL